MDWAVIFLEGMLVFATLILAFFTFMMWKATRELGTVTQRLADISESEHELRNRPRLIILSARKDNSSHRVCIRIKNIGSDSARWIAVNIGNRHWHGDGAVYAVRTSPNDKILETGKDDDWCVAEQDADLTHGKVSVGIIYQGFQLRPGASNFTSWGAYYSEDGVFSIEN